VVYNELEESILTALFFFSRANQGKLGVQAAGRRATIFYLAISTGLLANLGCVQENYLQLLFQKQQ